MEIDPARDVGSVLTAVALPVPHLCERTAIVAIRGANYKPVASIKWRRWRPKRRGSPFLPPRGHIIPSTGYSA
jgi:hypothetical protein